MADILTALGTHLLTAAPISSVVGSRVYPDVLPIKPTLPAIVIRELSNVPHEGIEFDAGITQARLHVRCYADTHLAAQSLRAACRAAVRGTPRGTYGGVIVRSASVVAQGTDADEPVEGSDQWRWNKWIDFQIFFAE